MRKYGWLSILSIMFIVLAACGGANSSETEEKNIMEQEEDIETNKAENENDSQNNETETIEDQLDLSIGDTGTFDTTLGQYEVTLDRAELIDGELEGEVSTRDGYIILDVTLKNITDETLDAEDLMYSMEVTSDLDYSGSQDHAHVFETLDAFEGDIGPGEEMSAQFMTIVDESDEYFFRKAVGNIAGGSSNQVVWHFDAGEAKK